MSDQKEQDKEKKKLVVNDELFSEGN
jgi:hypothetical protein